MKLFDRALKGIAQKRGLFVGPISEYVPTYSGVEAAGVNVNHKSALSFPAAFSAISTRADNIASLPKTVIEIDGKTRTSSNTHPLHKLISVQPNPYMNAYSFWQKNEANVSGWGNALNLIEWGNNGLPKHFWAIEPNNYQIITKSRQLFYKVLTGDFAGTYAAGDMLHFKYFTIDGINGIDPISYNAQALGIGLAGQKYAAEGFATKGKTRGVFEMENALGDTEYSKWMSRMSNLKDHSTPLLEYGIKFKDASFSPEAIQAIESRIFSIQDASRIWKVPPTMMAENSKSAFSNNEQQALQFVTNCLRPECKMFEKELHLKLFADTQRDKAVVKFNLDGLLRGDAKTRALVNHYAIMDGVKTRNEIRAIEKMNPIDGLDEPLVPLNMTTPEAMEQAIKDDENKNKE